jgi:RNA-directed DNA polymerase
MVAGTKDDAQALKEEIAGVLSTMGLRLSPEKTLITHINEGLDFLGWHIQRHRKRGSSRRYVYTNPSRKAVKAVTGKVKNICRTTDTNLPLDALLLRLNPALQGWCAYFRPGVSARAFSYLGYYTWQQAGRWLRRKHHRATWKDLRRLYYKGSTWWPAPEARQLFSPANVGTTRYRYRGTAIPAPGRLWGVIPCERVGAGRRHRRWTAAGRAWVACPFSCPATA